VLDGSVDRRIDALNRPRLVELRNPVDKEAQDGQQLGAW
jgi:hypothetical protein